MKRIIYLLSLTVLLAACDGPAIFYTLENEEKIVDINNFNSSTPVLGFTRFESGGTTDYYIANGRKLWYSLAGESGTDNPWSSVSLSGFSGSESVPSVAIFNGSIYFTVSDEDSNSKNVLYSLSSVTADPVELVRYNRTDESGDDYHFHNLYVHSIEGKGLYVSKVERSWEEDSSDSSSMEETALYYYPLASINELNDGLDDSRLVTLPAMDSDAYLVKGIAGCENDKIYLILNQSSDDVDSYEAGVLLSADWATPTDFSIETPVDDSGYTNDSAVSYNNIYYSESFDMLFVSTRGDDSHPIFYKAYNAGWGDWQVYDKDDDDTQFSAFTELPSTVQSNTVLVGTRAGSVSSSTYSGKGYRELIIGSQTIEELQSNDFSDDNNYDSSDLDSSTITAFYYDTDRSKMYCGTYDNGLWQNRWSTSKSEWRWYQE